MQELLEMSSLEERAMLLVLSNAREGSRGGLLAPLVWANYRDL